MFKDEPPIKLVPEIEDLTYEERLRKLELPTLTYRRSRGDMIETIKILCGEYEDCTEGLFTMRENDTRGNTRKIFKNRARLNIRKHAFPNRVVNSWNSMPESVISLGLVSTTTHDHNIEL